MPLPARSKALSSDAIEAGLRLRSGRWVNSSSVAADTAWICTHLLSGTPSCRASPALAMMIPAAWFTWSRATVMRV